MFMKNKLIEQITTESSKQDVFADPTYDTTFNMLFGSDQNKDILISLLNSLLDFKGDKEIVEVTISFNDLEVVGMNDIKGAVDVLCTIKNYQKITVKVQIKDKDYSLPSSQEFMSKIIASQIKEFEYDNVIMVTYLLVICKQNIFCGKYELNNKNLYECTVVPMVVQTQEEMEGNKMHWKFFELPKFANLYKKQTINSKNSLKEQWLDFLLKCNTKIEIPNDINDIIKKGYNIMKMVNWNEDQRLLYWKQKKNQNEVVNEQEKLQEEAFQKGVIKGVIKGEIKGEIKLIKCYEQMEIEVSNYSSKLNHIKPNMIEEVRNYIKEHQDESESVIGETLHLFEPMEIEQQ